MELGIDYGCRRFGTGRLKQKRALILESERYRFQAAISDLSGSDIRVHGSEPREIVVAVRNWLHDEANLEALGASAIWTRFDQFMADNHADLASSRGYSSRDIRDLSPKTLMKNMMRWVQITQARK